MDLKLTMYSLMDSNDGKTYKRNKNNQIDYNNRYTNTNRKWNKTIIVSMENVIKIEANIAAITITKCQEQEQFQKKINGTTKTPIK